MNASVLSKNVENSLSDNIIKMNHTIRELRDIAKERGLQGYFKFNKDQLISFLGRPIRLR